MPEPTPQGVKPVLFPQPLARARRLWLLVFPLAGGLAVAGWWPLEKPAPLNELSQLVDGVAPPIAQPPSTRPAAAAPDTHVAAAPDTQVVAPAPRRQDPPEERRVERSQPAGRTVGWLAVSSMPWGEVTVDERRVGPSPQTAIELTPGWHEVRIFRTGYKAYFAKVKIEAGKTARLTRISLPDESPR